MQANLTLKCGASVTKVSHKWAVQGAVHDPEAPREKIMFAEPIHLELGAQYSFSGMVSHDAGVPRAQYQYYNVTPQVSREVEGLTFRFNGQGNQGDWMQCGIAEILFCEAPQADDTLVRLTKDLWTSTDHARTIQMCSDALVRSWDQALRSADEASFHLDLGSQSLRRLRHYLGVVFADAEALNAFGLAKKFSLLDMLMHIVESVAPDCEAARMLVAESRSLWRSICREGFPDIAERRALTHKMFHRAFAPSDGEPMDLELVAAFLQSTAHAFASGVDVMEICDGKRHAELDPLDAQVFIEQMVQLALEGPLSVRTAAARMVTAVASSLALTVQCSAGVLAEPDGPEPPTEEVREEETLTTQQKRSYRVQPRSCVSRCWRRNRSRV